LKVIDFPASAGITGYGHVPAKLPVNFAGIRTLQRWLARERPSGEVGMARAAAVTGRNSSISEDE